ncbi:hypothetical protein C0Q70_18846 [Pomacea canaliculata]|uniref:Uncharacterized protein n=1 Tax=Pomacea canaliculata TaxID=400727 RepID=A0A2T7NHR6_POMCA|nr:hypothetical protein C0Q70_18846 [Pomacea canaliculata]
MNMSLDARLYGSFDWRHQTPEQPNDTNIAVLYIFNHFEPLRRQSCNGWTLSSSVRKNPKFPDELHRHLQADSGLPSLHKSLIPYLEQAPNLVQTTYPPNLSKREREGDVEGEMERQNQLLLHLKDNSMCQKNLPAVV